MHFFFQPDISAGVFQLDEEETRHAVKVMRLKVGSALLVTDGKGTLNHARLTAVSGRHANFEITKNEFVAKSRSLLHIAVAPTKNADRMEWFVEKATELGVDEISFLACDHSERVNINLSRLQKLSVSAMKQSQQAWLPKINTLTPFDQILANDAGQKLIAHAHPDARPLKTMAHPKQDVLILIGPEGDFSAKELKAAQDHHFALASLGKTRLRTETASLAACVLLLDKLTGA